MKVVINRSGTTCAFSPAAVHEILEAKKSSSKFSVSPFVDSIPLSDELRLPRNDTDLVAVVEKLQSRASANGGELVVVEIPDGEPWKVRDIAGMEFVFCRGEVWPKKS